MKKRVLILLTFLLVLFCVPVAAKANSLNVTDGQVFYGKNRNIHFIAHIGIWYGYDTGTNRAKFTIYKDGEGAIAQQEIEYNHKAYASEKEGDWKYFVTDYGTYTVRYAKLRWDNFNQMFVNDKYIEATFTVVPVSQLKKSKAYVTVDCYKEGEVTLSWSEDLDGAEIYRSDTENGKYKLIKTAKGSSYVDKSVGAKSYYYKVKTYIKSGKKTIKSKYSDIHAMHLSAPDVPVITSIKQTKKGVKIKWKKQKNCVSFWLYRKDKKDGMLEAIGGTDGDVFEILDETAEPGKTYYYRIQAYRPVYISITSMSKDAKITVK